MQYKPKPLKSMRWEVPNDPKSGFIRLMTVSVQEAQDLAFMLRYEGRFPADAETKTPVTQGLSEPNVLVKVDTPLDAEDLRRFLILHEIVDNQFLKLNGFRAVRETIKDIKTRLGKREPVI